MPSITLRWLRAYCGALTMAFFAFGATFIFCQRFSNFLEWVLPPLAALLALIYMPRMFYMWALRCDADELRYYRVLESTRRRIEEAEDEKNDDHEFPTEGYDGSDINRKF